MAKMQRIRAIVCMVGTYKKGDKCPPHSAGYVEFHAWADAQGRRQPQKKT